MTDNGQGHEHEHPEEHIEFHGAVLGQMLSMKGHWSPANINVTVLAPTNIHPMRILCNAIAYCIVVGQYFTDDDNLVSQAGGEPFRSDVQKITEALKAALDGGPGTFDLVVEQREPQ